MASQPAPRPGRRRYRRPVGRPRDAAVAGAACALLAWYNNLAGREDWHRRWYPAANVTAAAAALSAATAAGLTADDLGLSRDKLAAGLRLGAATAAPVAAAFALAPVTPAARPLLHDKRVAGLSARQLAYQVLLRIPFGTVFWEEIAFRGVLHAALRRVLTDPAAIAAESAMFGVWHIRPTAEALRANQLATGPAARIAAVGVVVASTAAAGALLSVLRERSGSLAAPVLLHLTANCAGPLASGVSTRLEGRAKREKIEAEDGNRESVRWKCIRSIRNRQITTYLTVVKCETAQ